MPASAVAPITIAAHPAQSSFFTAVTNAAVYCAKTLPTPATSTQGECIMPSLFVVCQEEKLQEEAAHIFQVGV